MIISFRNNSMKKLKKYRFMKTKQKMKLGNVFFFFCIKYSTFKNNVFKIMYSLFECLRFKNVVETILHLFSKYKSLQKKKNH
jgi:hypothetical protein